MTLDQHLERERMERTGVFDEDRPELPEGFETWNDYQDYLDDLRYEKKRDRED